MWNLNGDKDRASEYLRQRFGSMPARIPQIVSLEMGTNLSSPYTNRDFVLITRHRTLEDLYAYQEREYHEHIKTEVSPYLRGRSCVDFDED